MDAFASQHRPLHPHPTERDTLASDAGRLIAQGARLVMISCHQDPDEHLRVVYTFTADIPGEVNELAVSVPDTGRDRWIPSLAHLSYPAGSFEREMRDLYGIRPVGHPQPHRLVRHGHWPRGWYPHRNDAHTIPAFEPDSESFPFVEVEGPGIYEIAVGPIHAGIIDPGHFRFSVVGETIIRMEARQWYMHRGIEKLFEGRSPTAAIELAEAVAGDSVIGHSLAYVMAVEDALGIIVPEPDRVQRAIMLELERLYNHITDLGALANDAGYSIINAHALRLRETLLRHNQQITGHRFLRGALTLGGTRLDQLPDTNLLRNVAAAVEELVTLTLEQSIVRDRFTGTARLTTDQAHTLGTLGYIARASGIITDARIEHPFLDLGDQFTVVTETTGDVLARYLVRASEFAVSARLVVDLTDRATGRYNRPARTERPASQAGLGIVEGWRGAISHRVELGVDGTLTRVKIVDPAFLNWPALPIALSDTIVPDFPLTNKSFNQSYAGNDL